MDALILKDDRDVLVGYADVNAQCVENEDGIFIFSDRQITFYFDHTGFAKELQLIIYDPGLVTDVLKLPFEGLHFQNGDTLNLNFRDNLICKFT